MQIASSAPLTCDDCTSASEYTATDRTPIRCSVRMMRHAMAPRLAIRMVVNIGLRLIQAEDEDEG